MVERIDLDHGVKRHIPSGGSPSGGISPSALQTISQDAIADARDLGFVRVGIASLEPFSEGEERLEAFLASGFAGSMDYLATRNEGGQLLRSRPDHLLPDAQVAIVGALPYSAPQTSQAPVGHGRVATYAQGEDYHGVMRELLLALADQVAERVGAEVLARVCVDSAPLLERDLARRAGLTFFGKNTLAIAPGAGSHFLLGALLLDVPLTPSLDAPPDGCGSCTLCLDACPTDAFIGPHQLDARRCLSFLTIESAEPVPRELRAPLGDHLFGCDDCQSVCPYNAKGSSRSPHPRLAPQERLTNPSAIEMLKLRSSAYKRLVAGTALRRASRNQLARNAAIVLGNRADRAAVPALLEAAQSHGAPLVRTHATWALRQLAERHHVPEALEAVGQLRALNDPLLTDELEAPLHTLEESRSSHPAADTHRD